MPFGQLMTEYKNMNETGNFSSHDVLVVGGTSGIGRGIAEAFAAMGSNVVATGATQAEVSRASEGAPPNLKFVQLDVRSDDAVLAHFAAIDHLHVLVNCAGIIKRGEEHDPRVFAQVLDINLTGTMRTCSAARAVLKASGGCIVNTASMLSFFGGGLVPGYSASKGAIISV